MTTQSILDKYNVKPDGRTCGEVIEALKAAGASDIELDIVQEFCELMVRMGHGQ
jgi:hypothetical protein